MFFSGLDLGSDNLLALSFSYCVYIEGGVHVALEYCFEILGNYKKIKIDRG